MYIYIYIYISWHWSLKPVFADVIVSMKSCRMCKKLKSVTHDFWCHIFLGPWGGRDHFATLRFGDKAKKLRSRCLHRRQRQPKQVHAGSPNAHQGGRLDRACVARPSANPPAAAGGCRWAHRLPRLSYTLVNFLY